MRVRVSYREFLVVPVTGDRDDASAEVDMDVLFPLDSGLVQHGQFPAVADVSAIRAVTAAFPNTQVDLDLDPLMGTVSHGHGMMVFTRVVFGQ